MSDFIEKCYCSNDKYLWIGGAVTLLILLLVSFHIFEWFPEISESTSLTVQFWLWYGIAGFVLIILFLYFGGYCIYKYCNYQDVKHDETDVRFGVLIMGFVFLIIGGIVIMMVVDNFEKDQTILEGKINSYETRKMSDLKYDKDVDSDDFRYSENYVRKNYAVKYQLFNLWIDNNECEKLIDWADRNYLHNALSYAEYMIEQNCPIDEDLDHLNKILCQEKGGSYIKFKDGWGCTNWEPDISQGVAIPKKCSFTSEGNCNELDEKFYPKNKEECIELGGTYEDLGEGIWSCKTWDIEINNEDVNEIPCSGQWSNSDINCYKVEVEEDEIPIEWSLADIENEN